MKRSRAFFALIVALLMVTTSTLMVPASAHKPDVKVHIIGHFTTNLGSTTDHRCFINLHARKEAGEWTGQGFFRDRDYDGGQLVAIFIVEAAIVERLPYQINYRGHADVYINGEFVGNQYWESMNVASESLEAFSFRILVLKYNAQVFGEDTPLKTIVR